MPNGFFKCKEGVEAYKSVGREYDNTLDDVRYEQILKQTANSPHSARNKKVVRTMVRELADDGNEYIKYDLHELRYDAIGAFHEVYQPNVGLYPIPITQPTIELGADMTTKDIVSGPIVRIDTGYSIPFTKESADEIHKMSNDISLRERTQYIVKQSGGRRITVPRYEDFRNESFEALFSGTYLEQQLPTKGEQYAKMERQKEKIVTK